MVSSTNNIDISIIIVNYKSWKHLTNCLNSLKSLDKEMFSVEVIVVDNDSQDEILKDFQKEFSEVQFVLNSGNNGFANGCNFGASKAKGNYFLFLNPDTIANSKAIHEMWQFAKKNPQVGITSCLQKKSSGGYEKSVRIFPTVGTLFGLTRAIYKAFNKKQFKDNEEAILYTDWVSGSVVFISREWLTQIDGWNEDYWMYYEDMDLSKRVHESNGKVALLKTVEIIHNHGGASRLNIKTSALTKTEVLISKHVYIQNHFKGFERFLSHFLLILNNVLVKIILGFLGILLFFIPKMRLNVYLLTKMIQYYMPRFIKGNWLSSHSMNLK